MDRRGSAPEEQLHPLLEQGLLRRDLRAQRRWQGGFGSGRDDQEPVAGVAEVREATRLGADERIAAQVVELALQRLVAGLDVADLLAGSLSLPRDRVVR